jgi:hypothetical protein
MFARCMLIGFLLVLVPARPIMAAEGTSIASAVVDVNHPGLSIPTSFMGFSHEWSGGQQLMGSPVTGTNPIYRRLVRNLLDYGGGPIVVRIGGNSTDSTAEPQAGVVSPFAQLYADLGAQFILGVNLGSDDLGLATDQARAYVQGMPGGSLQAIEIGNEPDLFKGNGHRQSSYGFDDYLRDFAAWRSAIQPLLPPAVNLMGPAWSSPSSLANLPTFLDQETQSLGIISHHWYAGTQCNGRSNPPDYLLGPTAATSGARAVAGAVALAHQQGLPFRMGEMNSISCGGQAGVSDIFASALWATDSMFELASVGVDGVNIHTGNGGAYALFTFDSQNGTYAVPSIRPEYYGLLFFQQAAVSESRLLPVSLSTSVNLKVWSTVDAAGTVRVVVINKDGLASGPVSIQIAGRGSGTLRRLQAPALEAHSGITLGGQTFDGSPDGTLQGPAVSDLVLPSADGFYSFSMARVSAALLEVR